LGKKKITVPRIGIVKFGPERKARKKKIAVIILLAVILSSTLALMAMTHNMPFFLADLLKGYGSAVAFGLLAFTMFLFGGYYNDIPRLYLYGFLFGASLFLSECYYNRVGFEIHSSVWFGVSGLIILIIGISLLVKFTRDYLPPNRRAAIDER
jgi:membrane-bound ClpP family serine protease